MQASRTRSRPRARACRCSSRSRAATSCTCRRARASGVSRRLTTRSATGCAGSAQELDLGKGGAIIRTAAQGAKREDFEREMKYLHKLHEVLQQRGQGDARPGDGLPGGRPPGARRARHLLGQFEKAIVDDEKPAPPARSPSSTAPRRSCSSGSSSTRARTSRCSRSYGVEDAIKSVLRRRVDLPCGGYLMIDYAEAMTVIDVNSGSFTGRGKGAKLEDTITRTNLEAAEEVVRQLRLRDIGGIIVIDFIDMSRARNRDAVLKTLRKSLDEDRTKTYVVEISPLGLVEMTRQNVTDGVREILTKTCPTCEGEGVVLSEETVAIEVDRGLRDLVAERPSPPAFLIRVNPQGRHDPRGRHGVGRPLARARAGDRQALPLRGHRGAADRLLRGGARGHPRRGRGARAPVPRGRGGARPDRGAAHVQRGRRRGQARRLRRSRWPARAGWSARRRWCGSSRWAARRPRPRWSTRPRARRPSSPDGDEPRLGERPAPPARSPRRARPAQAGGFG